jgi:hypothetical protein
MKAVLPLLLLCLAACSREPEATAAAAAAAPVAGARADDTVAAVLQSQGKPAVALRFLFESRPVPGTASSLRLDLTSSEADQQLELRAQGEGLAVDPASGAALVTLAEAGKVVSHTVSFTPAAAGLTELVVRIRPAGEGAMEIVYAIPVLVDGAAPAAK